MGIQRSKHKRTLQDRIVSAEEELTSVFLKNKKQFRKNPRRREQFLNELMDTHQIRGTSAERYMYLKWKCVLKRTEWPVTLRIRN